MTATNFDGDNVAGGGNGAEGNTGAEPHRGQFQPGRSGNPKGRPRKVARRESAIESALNERVTITDSKGRRKRIPAASVIAKRLVQKAMAGDIAAIKELKAESPNFLKTILNPGNAVYRRQEFIAFLVKTMSENAVEEFRAALSGWEHERRRLELEGPKEPSGQQRG